MKRKSLHWEHLEVSVKRVTGFNTYVRSLQGHTDEQWAREEKLRRALLTKSPSHETLGTTVSKMCRNHFQLCSFVSARFIPSPPNHTHLTFPTISQRTFLTHVYGNHHSVLLNSWYRDPQLTDSSGLPLTSTKPKPDMRYDAVDIRSSKSILAVSVHWRGMRNGKTAATPCHIYCLSSGERCVRPF